MNSDFRVSTTFPDHRKTIKLIRRIGMAGVVSLVFLWANVAKTRPGGVLSRWDAEDIAIAGKWEGNPNDFVQALLDVGFLILDDEVYTIHEWHEHNGYASKAAERSRVAKIKAEKRWKERRERSGITDEMLQQCSSNATAMLQQCQTEEMLCCSNAPIPTPTPTPTPSIKHDFENDFREWWEQYPRKKGKAKAELAYIKRRKKGQSKELLFEALKRYVAECERAGKSSDYIQHGSTFLNGGIDDYIDGEPEEQDFSDVADELPHYLMSDQERKKRYAEQAAAEIEEAKQLYGIE